VWQQKLQPQEAWQQKLQPQEAWQQQLQRQEAWQQKLQPQEAWQQKLQPQDKPEPACGQALRQHQKQQLSDVQQYHSCRTVTNGDMWLNCLLQ
jgi:hypothetical protein